MASGGIAVLRYPKRTHVYGAASSSDPKTFTVTDEYIDDARAAVGVLASQPGIDRRRICLIGHSEGGYLAPRIASGDPKIQGVVVLAGNTRSIEDAALDQLHYLGSLPGPNAAAIRKMLPEVQAQADVIKSTDLESGRTVKLLNATIPSSYFIDLRRYNPSATAAKLRVPLYIAQGGRDYQVTQRDFATWQKALAGHRNVTLKVYPTLDHLLVPGNGPSTPSQYAEPGRHVSADLVRDLIVWISGIDSSS
jgi:dienelactone hydrolase